MNHNLKIIGDRIEFMGYTVGLLQDMPATIRDKFVHWLEYGTPMPPYVTNYATKVER